MGLCDPRLDTYDWQMAFECCSPPEKDGYGYNTPDIRSVPGPEVSLAPFQRKDVAEVVALAEGENDLDEWLLVGRLHDGRWFALRAGCDYTGWDCQSGGNADVSSSLERILQFGLTIEERRRLGLEGVSECPECGDLRLMADYLCVSCRMGD